MNDLAFLLRSNPHPLPASARQHLIEVRGDAENSRMPPVQCKRCGHLHPDHEFLYTARSRNDWGLCIACRREKRKTS